MIAAAACGLRERSENNNRNCIDQLRVYTGSGPRRSRLDRDDLQRTVFVQTSSQRVGFLAVGSLSRASFPRCVFASVFGSSGTCTPGFRVFVVKSGPVVCFASYDRVALQRTFRLVLITCVPRRYSRINVCNSNLPVYLNVGDSLFCLKKKIYGSDRRSSADANSVLCVDNVRLNQVSSAL